MKLETHIKLQTTYEPPRIEHKGSLKQFAGSPLSEKPDDNPLGLPGQ